VNSWSSVCPHGIISLQFLQNLISTDTLGQQLFHKVFRLVLLRRFGGFLVGGGFLSFQLRQFFLSRLESSFFSFRSAFKVSILTVIEVISEVREAIDSCFSTI
jgi:hypothetical protein